METLEELKNKYKKLKEESNNLYNKIRALENQDKISKFTVGEVYLFTKQVDNTQDWKTIVETHGIEQWVYRDDIVSLIFKKS